MQPISEQTRELIDRLYEPAPFVHRFLAPGSHQAALLALISEASEPASIPYLLPLALSGDAVAQAAASAIRQILETIPTLGLVELDLWVREVSPYRHPAIHAWDQLRPRDLPRLSRLSDGWTTLAMATFHRNGYVREAAIRQLALISMEKALPYLLIRLNDWVSSVRRAAEEATQAYLAAPRPEALVEALPLLVRMRSWCRGDHQPFIEAILQRLQQPGSRHALARGMESSDRLIRRESFRLALTSARPDLPQLVERALADSDSVIRLQAVLCFHMLGDEPLRRLTETARRDPIMAIRREALAVLSTRLPSEAGSVLRDALLDPHSSIRELARRHLQLQPSGFDAPAFYRDALQIHAGPRLRAAILGLSETGASDDAHRARPFCGHSHAKIREAAVRAVARLDDENHIDAIMDALADPSPRVSREAGRVLNAKKTLLFVDMLREYAGNDRRPKHVRLNALRLLASLGKWTSLLLLLRTAETTDSEVAAAVREQLGGWHGTYHRSFVKPTPQQLTEIEEALSTSDSTLDPALRRSIQVEVSFWRRLN